MPTQAIINPTTPAHQFILSQLKSEEVVNVMPYSEAVELAQAIISNGPEAELKFAVRGDIYELIEWQGKFEVRVTYRNPCTSTTVRIYSTFLSALAELQRVYHEAIGWAEGLNALFVPENDHQANGQRDRQEHEIRICADLDSAYYTTKF